MPSKDIEFRANLREHIDASWKFEQAKARAALSLTRIYANTVAGLASDITEHTDIASVLRQVDDATVQFEVALQGELLPAIDESAVMASEMVSSSASIADVTAGLPDARFAVAVKGTTVDSIRSLTFDARKIVRREVQLGALGQDFGATTRSIAQQLKSRLTFKSIEARSRAIAQTEIAKVYNLTSINSIESAQQVNPDVLVQWLHARFGVLDPRPAHVRLHLTTQEKGETFSVNGHRAKGPHDPSLPASEVVHCSCRSVLNVKQADGKPFELAGWAAWPIPQAA